jgi:hypothetical protein
VILICFAVDSPDSLDNVQEKVSSLCPVCFGYLVFLWLWFGSLVRATLNFGLAWIERPCATFRILARMCASAFLALAPPPFSSFLFHLVHRPPNFILTDLLQWISEVMHFCAGLPIILVGCKKDLRRDPRVIEELRKTSQRPVTPEEVSVCLPSPALISSFLAFLSNTSIVCELGLRYTSVTITFPSPRIFSFISFVPSTTCPPRARWCPRDSTLLPMPCAALTHLSIYLSTSYSYFHVSRVGLPCRPGRFHSPSLLF